jgi:predicted RND superfamily exporter protein
MLDPRALERLVSLERSLLSHGQIARVDSVLPLLRDVWASLGNDTSTDGSLPREAAEIGEVLFLLRSSAPEVLEEFVTIDGSLARFSAALQFSNSSDDVALLDRIQADASAIVTPGRATVTGYYSINARLAELILDTQISSFSGAFVTIFLVLALFVGSVRYALLGMIPNVFPIVVTLGLMGLWGIRLDMGTAMIASILIGISVDDTVYFLLHYRSARRRGLEIPESIRYTFAFSGNAAMFSTVILAAGFSLLVLSRFQSLAYFGLLSAFAVLLAVASELLFLPAVLVTGERAQQWATRRLG